MNLDRERTPHRGHQMKIQPISAVTGAVILVAAAAIPANARPASDTDVPPWLEVAPEFPVEQGISPDELSPRDVEAIASFQAEFPWAEAFAAFGCAASDINIGDDGGKSMILDCAESQVAFEDISKIPSIAIAAAKGEADAIDDLTRGALNTTAALSDARLESRSTVAPMATSCGNTGNQNHCLDNNATYFMASSVIRTLSGSSTGKNRLGRVGTGSCADGTLMKQSVTLTISTTTYSYVDSPSYANGQLSSRWTMSPLSYSRYCAVV